MTVIDAQHRFGLVEIQPLSPIDLVKSLPNIFHAETKKEIKSMVDLVFANTHTDVNRALRELTRLDPNF